MRKVWIVQVTFTGVSKTFNDEAQSRCSKDYYINGMHRVLRTKRARDNAVRDFADLGDVAVAERLAPESWEEAFMAINGLGKVTA